MKIGDEPPSFRYLDTEDETAPQRRVARLAVLAGAAGVAFLISLPVVFPEDFTPWPVALDYPGNTFSATTAVDSAPPNGFVLHTVIGSNDGSANVHGLITSGVYTDTVPIEGPFSLQGTNLVNNACCAPRHSTVVGSTGQLAVSGSDGATPVAHWTPYIVLYPKGGTGQIDVQRIDATRTNAISTSQHITTTGLVVTTYSFDDGGLWLYTSPVSETPTFSFVNTKLPADSPTAGIHWDGELRGDVLWILAPYSGSMWLRGVVLATGAVTSQPLGLAKNSSFSPLYYANLTLCSDGRRLAGSYPDPDSDMQTTFITDPTVTTVITTTHTATVPDVQAVVCIDDIVVLHRADPDGSGVQDVELNFASTPPIVKTVVDDARDADISNVFPTTAITVTAGIPIVEVDRPAARGGTLQATVRHGWLSVPMFFDTFESGDTSFWSGATGVVP